MTTLLSELFPLLYGACFVVLLWQAFRVMSRGFRAVPRPGDPGSSSSTPSSRADDRTGRLTVHPELLDDEGRLTQEDLLTVRFGGDNERPAIPGEPG
jgi:hypothetical protein